MLKEKKSKQQKVEIEPRGFLSFEDLKTQKIGIEVSEIEEKINKTKDKRINKEKSLEIKQSVTKVKKFLLNEGKKKYGKLYKEIRLKEPQFISGGINYEFEFVENEVLICFDEIETLIHISKDLLEQNPIIYFYKKTMQKKEVRKTYLYFENINEISRKKLNAFSCEYVGVEIDLKENPSSLIFLDFHATKSSLKDIYENLKMLYTFEKSY